MDELVEYPPPTSDNILACEVIEVYQQRKSIKWFSIRKGEALPGTQTP
jgi:hypothetical protein